MSAVRVRITIGSSRSSTGTSASEAVSARNQNAVPVPLWMTLPLRRCTTCEVGVARRWRQASKLVMSAMSVPLLSSL